MTQDDLIARLHRSPLAGVLAVTGGGSGAISRLLATPGASGTVLEAIVPYSARSLAEWLGAAPKQACSESTARAMAMRAYARACELSAEAACDPADRFGVGCTASLASDRPKRGEHRAHVAVQTGDQTRVLSLHFEKGRRTRAQEEQAVTHALIALLAAAAELSELDLEKTPEGITAETRTALATPEIARLFNGERAAVALHGAPAPGAEPVCLFPGSFNPPHAGHDQIARVAAARTGRAVVAELSITNVDKPPLDFLEIESRLEMLAGWPLWLTRAPTFVEKAELAPEAVFAVGADTIERIGEPRYYGVDSARRDAAVARLAELGATYLVFGRVVRDRFEGLEDLAISAALRELCEGVGEDEFRVDVSSTELREGG